MTMVGTARKAKALAVCGYLSMSTLTKAALPLYLSATALNTGAKERHGPHQEALKSMTIGRLTLVEGLSVVSLDGEVIVTAAWASDGNIAASNTKRMTWMFVFINILTLGSMCAMSRLMRVCQDRIRGRSAKHCA